jgi:WD40 repeat protein
MHKKFVQNLMFLMLIGLMLATLTGQTAYAQAWADAIIDRAFQDLSGRIGQTVNRTQPIHGSWSWEGIGVTDNNLGCANGAQAAPGQNWAMKIVINLDSFGTYDYRATRDGTIFFLCSATGVGAPTSIAPTPVLSQGPVTYKGPILAYRGFDGNIYITDLNINPGPTPLTGDAGGRRTTALTEDDKYYNDLSWSPDGLTLAFRLSAGNPIQYLVPSGQAPIQAATNISMTFPSAWSPNGQELGYAVDTNATTNPNDPSAAAVFQMQAIPRGGGQPRAVGTFSAQCFGDAGGPYGPAEDLYWSEAGFAGTFNVLEWLPQGILHSSCFGGGLTLSDFSGKTIWDLGNVYSVIISPDRTRAVAKQGGSAPGTGLMTVINLANGVATPLQAQPGVDQFAWSGDGQTILYSTRTPLNQIQGDSRIVVNPNYLPSWPINGTTYDIGLWSIPAAGGQSIRLFAAQGEAVGAISASPTTAVAAASVIDSVVPFIASLNAGETPAVLQSKLPKKRIAIVALVPNTAGYPYQLEGEGGRPTFSAAAQFTAVPAPLTVAVTATPVVSPGGCPGAPATRLVIGGRGQVTPGEPNALNSQPAPASRDPNSKRLNPIPPGGVFTVLDGPVCAWNYAWWKVNYNGVIGWTAEGEGATYWVQPIQ